MRYHIDIMEQKLANRIRALIGEAAKVVTETTADAVVIFDEMADCASEVEQSSAELVKLARGETTFPAQKRRLQRQPIMDQFNLVADWFEDIQWETRNNFIVTSGFSRPAIESNKTYSTDDFHAIASDLLNRPKFESFVAPLVEDLSSEDGSKTVLEGIELFDEVSIHELAYQARTRSDLVCLITSSLELVKDGQIEIDEELVCRKTESC